MLARVIDSRTVITAIALTGALALASPTLASAHMACGKNKPHHANCGKHKHKGATKGAKKGHSK